MLKLLVSPRAFWGRVVHLIALLQSFLVDLDHWVGGAKLGFVVTKLCELVFQLERPT